jgi:peptide deformylase
MQTGMGSKGTTASTLQAVGDSDSDSEYVPKVLEIVQVGAAVLLRRAEAVDEAAIHTPVLQRLVQDMRATMIAAPGIGLAAPQIGQSLRIVVFYLPDSRDPSGVGVPFSVLINPLIEKLGDAESADWEGCLSVAGKRGLVSRPARIRYTGLDENGEAVDVVAEGWHARVVQHEVDHLDGVLYPTRMQGGDELLDVEEWRRLHAS